MNSGLPLTAPGYTTSSLTPFPDIDPSLFLLPDREGLFGLIRATERSVSQFGNSTREPQRHTQNLFQTMDNVVWTKGSHAVKMGVQLEPFSIQRG